MKRIILFLLGALLLTAQAEEIDSPIVHAEEMASEFVAVDISPVITFQTDETGVFAVVTVEPLSIPLSSSEELMVEQEAEETEEQATFLVTSSFTARSITYTLTSIPPEQGKSN